MRNSKSVIISHGTAEGRRRKKVFIITDTGLAKPEKRIAAVRNYICQTHYEESALCVIREYFRRMQEEKLPPGTDWAQIFRFQEYTMEYGIAAAAFEISWHSRLLRKLEEQP